MKAEKEIATFGNVFELLATLANGQFGPRNELFATAFRSYHDWRSVELGDDDFRTSQALVCAIAKNKKPLPRKFVFFYAQGNGAALRYDVDLFFRQAIQTGRQEELYFAGIIDLVNKSTNLTQRDKAYILDATEVNTNTVCEIWFRAIYVLMLEPACVQQAG